LTRKLPATFRNPSSCWPGTDRHCLRKPSRIRSCLALCLTGNLLSRTAERFRRPFVVFLCRFDLRSFIRDGLRSSISDSLGLRISISLGLRSSFISDGLRSSFSLGLRISFISDGLLSSFLRVRLVCPNQLDSAHLRADALHQRDLVRERPKLSIARLFDLGETRRLCNLSRAVQLRLFGLRGLNGGFPDIASGFGCTCSHLLSVSGALLSRFLGRLEGAFSYVMRR